jgi:hypothetical protein
MLSKGLNLSITVSMVLLLAACGSHILVTPRLPTLTEPVSPTSMPVSVASTAPTRTPVPDFTPTLLPIQTASPILDLSSNVSSLPRPGVFVDHTAMDDKYIYWTESGGNLYRYPLDLSKITAATVFASSHFAQGTLAAYPNQSLSRIGAWLIFDDRQFTDQTNAWALRAENVETQTERILAQGAGSTIFYQFSSDGEWVVWIAGELSTGDILTAENLQTGQRQELARSYSAQLGWEQVAVSAGQAAAIYRGENGRTLSLFDLKSGQSHELLSVPPDSDMDGLTFDGHWIAWKTGTNYQGPTALYNLQTGQTERLPDWGIAPLLFGGWLTWEAASEQPLYLVNLDTHQSYRVAEAQPGDELTSVAMYGNLIAWCRLHSEDHNTKVDSTLEWLTLP